MEKLFQILQHVQAGNLKTGQQVRFPDKKAWWTVIEKKEKSVTLSRGHQRRRVNLSYPLLQEPFENL